MKKTLAILLLTAWTWGCSTSPTRPSASVVVPAGWVTASTQDSKLKMSMPSEWIVVDSKSPQFKDALAELTRNNPSLGSIDTRSYYLMAFDRKVKDGFSDNLNVVKRALPRAMPFDDATAQSLKKELTRVLPVQGELELEMTRLSFGSAYRYRAPLKYKTDSGGLTTYAIGYMVCQGNDLYTVTFSTTPKNKDAFTETARQVMDTFSVSP